MLSNIGPVPPLSDSERSPMSEDVQSCILRSACEITGPGVPNVLQSGLSPREQALLDFQLFAKNGSANVSVLTLTEAFGVGTVDFDAYLRLQCSLGCAV